MRNYIEVAESFDVDVAVRAALTGDLSSLNACIECCDRHAESEKIALRWIGQDSRSATTYSFAELRDLSAKFAGFLHDQGVRAGDRVGGLLPRIPELLITILATWRIGAVYQPLFTAFGPKAIEHRVNAAATSIIVTDAKNRLKLDGWAGCPTIVVVGEGTDTARDFDFWKEVDSRQPDFKPILLTGDDPFLMMFTSGTTGAAKPLLVPLKAIVAFIAYMRDAIGLTDGDTFWNIADPGWAYGLYYAVTGPLALGCATTFYDGPFSVESTYRIINTLGITNLAGAPTAYRLLVAAGPDLAKPVKGSLRAVSSAGEPLNPEVIRWFKTHMSVTIHDHYGQTELGMVLCNHHQLAHSVRMGSAGFAVPGHRVVVVDEAGKSELPKGQPGILAIDRSRSPLFWFEGYWQQPTPSFIGQYYLSGDTVETNDDGSISFIGRSDDVITTAGYRVGPFDVESALIEHPSVVETAVIGKPDRERTEIVKAFVVLKAEAVASSKLADDLQQHVKTRLSAHSYPREIEFVTELPKTPSGKVQRFILRNQEIANSAQAKSAS